MLAQMIASQSPPDLMLVIALERGTAASVEVKKAVVEKLKALYLADKAVLEEFINAPGSKGDVKQLAPFVGVKVHGLTPEQISKTLLDVVDKYELGEADDKPPLDRQHMDGVRPPTFGAERTPIGSLFVTSVMGNGAISLMQWYRKGKSSDSDGEDGSG